MKLTAAVALALAIPVASLAAQEFEGIQAASGTATPDPSKITSACDTGGLVYDDGNFEAAYQPGSILFRGSMAMQMTVESPMALEQACVCWVRNGSDSSIAFDLRVWDSDGPNGSPGTLLGELPNQRANSIPTTLPGKFYSYDMSSLGITTSRPVYIGPSWFPGDEDGIYLCTDTSPSTQIQRGFGSSANLTNPTAIPRTEFGFPGAIPDYRAFGIRSKFSESTGTECIPDEDTLCLVNGRFKVEIAWESNDDSGIGQARTIPGVDFSGLFWFFNSSNLEMLVKVIDGCGLNQKFWVFYAATTNVGFEMTVTDTSRGTQKVYRNTLGNAAAPVQDTGAFSCIGLG